MKIAPSMLAADFGKLNTELKEWCRLDSFRRNGWRLCS